MKKNVFALCGSTRNDSSNIRLLRLIASMQETIWNVEIFDQLDQLPHFNPDVDSDNTPSLVLDFRAKVKAADAIVICTPEYVFSLPGSLKNALEWTVSQYIFVNKPMALITASGQGLHAHESLELIMRTLEGKFTAATRLLISGARSKVPNLEADLDGALKRDLEGVLGELEKLME